MRRTAALATLEPRAPAFHRPSPPSVLAPPPESKTLHSAHRERPAQILFHKAGVACQDSCIRPLRGDPGGSSWCSSGNSACQAPLPQPSDVRQRNSWFPYQRIGCTPLWPDPGRLTIYWPSLRCLVSGLGRDLNFSPRSSRRQDSPGEKPSPRPTHDPGRGMRLGSSRPVV